MQIEHALDIPESLVGISPAYILHRRSRAYVNTPEKSNLRDKHRRGVRRRAIPRLVKV